MDCSMFIGMRTLDELVVAFVSGLHSCDHIFEIYFHWFFLGIFLFVLAYFYLELFSRV